MGYENDAFVWENQLWANLSNGIPYNSGGEKVAATTEKKEEGDKGKEKKRRRDDVTPTKKGKKKGESSSNNNNNNSNNNNGEKKKITTKEGGSEHAMHIWTERERRKRMRNMFCKLHSLLPQLPPKADKSTIVDEAVNYVRVLQSTLQRLQKYKLERVHGVGPSNSRSFEPSVAANSTIALLSTREAFRADQVSAMNNNTVITNTNNNNNGGVNPKTSTVLSASASHLPVRIQTWTSSNVVLNICGNDAQFAIYAPKKDGLFTSICAAFENHNLELISSHISSDVDRCVYMIQARMASGASDQFPENVTVEEIYKQVAGDIMLCVSSN